MKQEGERKTARERREGKMSAAVASRSETENGTYLPLSGEVPVPGGDTKQEGVVGRQNIDGDQGVVGLRRGVHLGENLLREGLGDSVNVVMVWSVTGPWLTTAREKKKSE